MRRTLRIAAFSLLSLLLLLAGSGYAYWRGFDLERQPPVDPATRVEHLQWLQPAAVPPRGRILAVVTSTAKLGRSERKAGFELTELARAYYVFLANGYAVDIASPRGGAAPMRLDDELVEADYAFLNDAEAQAKVANTLALAAVDPTRYAAVYFVGGKGTMFDFPNDPHLPRIVRAIYRQGVVGAVCHGPAALINVTLDDGRPLLHGRRVTGFSNAEELFLIENARELFPFLLQDRLSEIGGQYVEGPLYLDHTVVDGRLVTGQNPWSTWSVAEAMIRALGHEPVPRPATAEELSVRVLAAYAAGGTDAARAARSALPQADKRLLLMHALIATMQGRLGDAVALQNLARG